MRIWTTKEGTQRNKAKLTKKQYNHTKMENKNSLEQQVKALQRQMGGIAKLVKDLKSSVDNLEKKRQMTENKEIQEIIDTQKVIDEIIVSNSDAIKRMEREIKEISTKKKEN
jgi:hypothetical protein